MPFKLTPSPTGQLWVLQVKHLLHYRAHVKGVNFVQEGGAGKKIFLRPV